MKTILSLLTGVLLSTILAAQTNGPFEGRSFSSSPLAGNSQTWSNPLNAETSNDLYTTFGNLPDVVGTFSNYLLAMDFGFDIPPAAVIKGIKVEVERSDPNGKTADYSIRIVREGELGTQEKSTGALYPANDAYITYGGSNDLWGESWSFKNISNNDFGIAISAKRNASGGVTGGRIDDIKVTVYYSFTTLPVTLVSFTATKTDHTVAMKWITAGENNMDQYRVERSADGRFFSSIRTIPATNQTSGEYSHIDMDPLPGTSYYRLAMIGIAGDRSLSKVIPIQFRTNSTIALSPSPWTKGNDLTISNPMKERLTIQFYKADGKIAGKAITGTHEVPVPFLADMKGLIYFKVTDENNRLKGTGSLLVY